MNSCPHSENDFHSARSDHYQQQEEEDMQIDYEDNNKKKCLTSLSLKNLDTRSRTNSSSGLLEKANFESN